ncbi:MAG TPA: hypothetical protein VFI95_20615 [Terriglobales bacterium]|nr:hypothetical protein [Terriglobales bacterium]
MMMMRSASRVLAHGIALAVLVLPVALTAETWAANTSNEESQPASSASPESSGINAPADPLLRLMVSQGLVTADDVKVLGALPSAEVRDRLLLLLLAKNKGTLSAADISALKNSTDSAHANTEPALGANALANPAATQASGPPQPPRTPLPSGPIPAVTPIRVLQVDPSKREGFVPAIKIGEDARITPYGLFKASAIYDTSSPYGNDFPLPGFNGLPNTVDAVPEFHVKARFFRFGSNFEWLDTPHVIITGKVEADFEGNFSRANNRNISSIRSNALQLRLAYGRIDWKRSDKTSLFLLAGQDWTPFGSSTLPNLFETTGLGIGFGTLYERDPQVRFGMEHNFGKFKLAPEFAIVLPAFGNLPADLTTAGVINPNGEGVGNQLGFGERQGADSARPEIQARLVGQFQLDHAAGVPPAQIIVSGARGVRTVDVDAAAVPAAFKAAFPTGAQVSSTRLAWSGEIQLPTRYLTLIAKYYNGNDLRFYFAGQIFGPFNDTLGLTNVSTAQSIDGSSTLAFGLRQGAPVVARSLPPRSQGGFVNIGIPLSRLANANPMGRNAGWVFYAHYGYDQVLARDVRREGGGRKKGDVAAGTLQYKLNKFVTFVVEESLYRTRALPLTSTGNFPLFEGRPMREWKDFRSEIGPIFTF